MNPPDPPSRRREAARGLLAAALSLLIGLGLVEAFLRLVYDPLEARPGAAPPNWEASVSLYEPDPFLEYRLKPGLVVEFVRQSDGATIAVRTNNLGFRDDRDYLPERPPGVRRVLLLGDSLVFGAGVAVEEAPAAQVEAALAARLDTPVEVMGWGVPGYGQEQERRLLEALDAPSYAPDLVLVLITTQNDFGRSLRLSTLADVAGGAAEPGSAGESGDDPPPGPPEPPPSLAERLKRPLRSLRTYRLLAVYANRILGMAGRRRVEVAPEAVASTQADLAGLLAYAADHDLRLAFVLVPPRSFALPLTESYAYDRAVYVHYRRLLEALGADWLDLEPALIDGAARRDPAAVYWDDVHLTAAGSRIAGEAIADFAAPRLAP